MLNLSAPEAAPRLLGWELVRSTPKGEIRLKIVETEAYHQADPASHSHRGATTRTAPMFEQGGRLYVYFIYGVHYCLNIVTGPKGSGEAVLIRAGEPIDGVELMRKNRSITDIHKLANGPAKLTQALGINDTKLSGEVLSELSISLKPPATKITRSDILVSSRIGIKRAVDELLRFSIKDNKYISGV
ncbi:DNA-3-methyladenine glycosylase [Candidatus Saccharibacteria bacterium]|nr:DNA-3-methyladenine glycosylase [Candidatus Saccharibacteria bacterium]